ncbi:MAG TPA: TIGR02587 family membrane protein [Thermomicrobiales bacterium]|nr:TIGR02587 family membrane protein [Thermomicrobiales bacterium]
MVAWKNELNDFIRAFSGAYIFGVPLLFTMEMWWIGDYISPYRLMIFLGTALVANLGLTWVAGFKRQSTFATSIDEAIDAVAVGLISGFIMLVILNQVRLGDTAESVLGKVVVQAIPLSIGASVANQVFGTTGKKQRQGEGTALRLSPAKAFLSDVGATVIGGIFIGFSVAPTDEVPVLAASLEYRHLMALIGFSLVISYGIIFAGGFRADQPPGLFQRPVTETILAYIVSLLVAFGSLYLFGQIDLGNPPLSIIQQTVVLGVPTTVGGAAGRLVI